LRRFFDSRQYIRAFNELPLVEEGGAVRRIDRLVEFADEVWVIDYKTGGADPRMESEFDTAYRDQVGAYCRSIQSVYPARRIRGALVFADGEIVEVSGETA
jgi:ATP-dependent helicase/nuclease subunit A